MESVRRGTTARNVGHVRGKRGARGSHDLSSFLQGRSRAKDGTKKRFRKGGAPRASGRRVRVGFPSRSLSRWTSSCAHEGEHRAKSQDGNMGLRGASPASLGWAGLGWAGCRRLVEGVCPGAPEGFILSPNLHSASHAVGVVVDWASAGVPMLVRRRSGRGSALDWASWRCLSAKTGITRTRSGGGVHGGGGGEGEVGHGANLGMGGGRRGEESCRVPDWNQGSRSTWLGSGCNPRKRGQQGCIKVGVDASPPGVVPWQEGPHDAVHHAVAGRGDGLSELGAACCVLPSHACHHQDVLAS